jgi:DNA-binding sugar fermentation-stimulating protein
METQISEREKIVAKFKPKLPPHELFRLNNLVQGEFLCRPSKHNRSPFVGDVLIDGEEKIVHVPSMDMGGKCRNGTKIYMKEAKNKGKRSKKYDTPCCDYISQAIIVDEPENSSTIICGAHPALGESIAESLLKVGKIFYPMSSSQIVKIKGQVSNIAGCNMRSDFLVETEDGNCYLIEVKTVVDTDYNPQNGDFYRDKQKILYYGNEKDYIRKSLFPWGRSSQKGPDGEKVVSARAIKHVREMTEIAQGLKKDTTYPNIIPYVLFVIVRNDVKVFSPNKVACPSFHKYLKLGLDSGVKMNAISVSFTDDESSLVVTYEKVVPIIF